MPEGARTLAVFFDFENVGLSFHGRERFDIGRVLDRLIDKGKIVAKKAYADWNRFSHYTASLHEAAIELVEIPRRSQTGKNSADIRLCVDAMDLAYSKDHIDTFVVVSGDSDFSPLVSKLKELGKHVIGLGMQASTSDLLRDNCDEFIYYEDLGRAEPSEGDIDPRLPEGKRKVFALLLEALHALRRENKEALWSSMVKDTMKRKKPSFNEAYFGYRTFSELLQDAAHHGICEIEIDKRSRTFTVTRFGDEPRLPKQVDAPPPPPPPQQQRPAPPSRPTPPPPKPAPEVPPAAVVEKPAASPPDAEPVPAPAESANGTAEAAPAKRRRRRGSGNGNGKAEKPEAATPAAEPPPAAEPAPAAKAKPKKAPARRGRAAKPKADAAEVTADTEPTTPAPKPAAPPAPKPVSPPPLTGGFGAGIFD